MSAQYYEGIGRRKTATARVRISAGSGNFVVNQKSLEEFFTRFGDTETILAPFRATGENQTQYDVSVLVSGGGVNGQTTAVQLGLAGPQLGFRGRHFSLDRLLEETALLEKLCLAQVVGDSQLSLSFRQTLLFGPLVCCERGQAHGFD
jgi:ribosomal protein S9